MKRKEKHPKLAGETNDHSASTMQRSRRGLTNCEIKMTAMSFRDTICLNVLAISSYLVSANESCLESETASRLARFSQ